MSGIMDRFVVFAQDFNSRVVNGVSVMPNHGQAGGAPAWLTLGDGTTASTFPTPLASGATFDGGDYVNTGVVDRYERDNQFSLYFYGSMPPTANLAIMSSILLPVWKGIILYTGWVDWFEIILSNAIATNYIQAQARGVGFPASKSFVCTYGGAGGGSVAHYIDGVSRTITVPINTLANSIKSGLPWLLGGRSSLTGGLVGTAYAFGIADGILAPADIAQLDVLVKARMGG